MSFEVADLVGGCITSLRTEAKLSNVCREDHDRQDKKNISGEFVCALPLSDMANAFFSFTPFDFGVLGGVCGLTPQLEDYEKEDREFKGKPDHLFGIQELGLGEREKLSHLSKDQQQSKATSPRKDEFMFPKITPTPTTNNKTNITNNNPSQITLIWIISSLTLPSHPRNRSRMREISSCTAKSEDQTLRKPTSNCPISLPRKVPTSNKQH
ncbi:hypothetical protein EV2_032333 [Malus domestica]